MCFTVYSFIIYLLFRLYWVKIRGPQALFAITLLLFRIINLPYACQKGWDLGHGIFKDSTSNSKQFGAFQTSGASAGLIYLMCGMLWKQKGPMTCTVREVDINMSTTQNAKLQRMNFSAYVSCFQQHEHANKSFQNVIFT